MGAGASVDLSAVVQEAAPEELAHYAANLLKEPRDKLLKALESCIVEIDGDMDYRSTDATIAFDVEDSTPEGGVAVSIISLSGEAMSVHVGSAVTVDELKLAVADRLGIEACDFALTTVDSLPGSTRVLALADGCEVVSLYMSRHTTLAKYEAEAATAWQDLVAVLKNQDIDDRSALVPLQEFLSAYPAMVNLQMRHGDSREFKPLLSFAIEGIGDITLRQLCVDELLSRGARVHIRHAHGFLIESADLSGSGFIEYLKTKEEEFRLREADAIAAWRNVSSKLCGETSNPIFDEDEMTKLVQDFCERYPAMVNFQNNHACNSTTDVPYGYFGYAPLLTFAGGRACRARRGQDDESKVTRFASFQELLRHGARVDIAHGGKNVLEWMRSEGSELVDWLESQFEMPMPEHVPFAFARQGQ